MRNKNKFGIYCFIALISLLSVSAAFGSVNSLPFNEYAEGEVIVVMNSTGGLASKSVSSAQAASVEAFSGAKVVRQASAIARTTGKNIMLVKSDTMTTSELKAKIASMQGNPSVFPNYKVGISGGHRAVPVKPMATPNDPNYSDLWGMRHINAESAWNTTTGDSGVFVAVIDTGINYNHMDIAANMGQDADGNYGIDTINEDSNPMDDHGHGTHVAGTIGAVGNNNIGVVGVNWNVRLLGVKVLNHNGMGFDMTIIDGIDYIIAQKLRGVNVKVANLSLGGWRDAYADQTTSPYYIALKAAVDSGIFVAVAAGNEYQNIDNPGGPGSDPSSPTKDYRGKKPYPASFSINGMLTVSALSSDNNMAQYSNYSATCSHLAAPGSRIWSTNYLGGYMSMSGTSMAAPHVAGVGALVSGLHPAETPAQIATRIVSSVSANPVLVGKTITGGNLDAAASLGAVAVPVTGVQVLPTDARISVGGEVVLTATVLPANATNKNVSWISSNPAVASVSATGRVTGIRDGQTVVTARTVEGGFTATCVVTVGEYIPVTGISLSKSSVNMNINEDVTVTATVSPERASNKNVEWNTSNSSVAIVSSNGVITGYSKGSATITARTVDGGFTATVAVTVAGGADSGGGGCNAGANSMISVFLLLPAVALFFKKN